MSEINELWILVDKNGHNTGRSYLVVRKYKRRTGYSVRQVDMSFTGYKHSSRVEKFPTWTEVLQYLQDKHPRVTNYGITASLKEVIEAFNRLSPEAREFWSEEIKATKGGEE